MTQVTALERCAHCALPLGKRGGDPSRDGEPRYCCSGCCLADNLSARGGKGSADALLARLVLSAFLAMGVMVFSLSLYGARLPGGDPAELASEAADALRGVFRMGAWALATAVAFLLLVPLAEAVARTRRWLSADGLIVLGTSAAYGLSTWNALRGGGEVYFDTATMVLVLVTLGRWLDVRARERARRELELLLPQRVQPVAVVREGREVEAPPEEVRVGELVRVRPGEVLAVDGLVVEGRAFLDASSLTGEAEPRSVGIGDRALAGCTALDGSLLLRATAVGEGRVRDEVERLLGEALETRARHVQIADRLAGTLLPLVIGLAIATAVFHWSRLGAEDALLAALSVVLISCPCALGIATPLAFWVALGRAWRAGALVRGGEVLERLARVRRVAFDKTGTLTSGELELRGVSPAEGIGPEEALRLAAAVELGSEHPIGRALRRAWLAREAESPLGPPPAARDFRPLAGIGVEASIEGSLHQVRRSAPGEDAELEPGGRRVELVRGGELLAVFRLVERARPETPGVLRALRAEGLELVVLTGDGAGPAARLAAELGVEARAELLPGDKVELVRGGRTAFVGDGLNDAAALAAAEVGIAVAGGVARSMEAAGIDLLRPSLDALPELVRLARAAVRVARQNLAWAFGYNAIGLGFAATGRLDPILAAGAMVASSLAVVLNTRRLAAGEPAAALRGARGVPAPPAELALE